MDVAVDAARQHELPAGIDLASAPAFQLGFDGGDEAVLDGDISFDLAILGDNTGVADDEIVVGHSSSTPPPCVRVPRPRAAARVAQ